MYFQLVPSTLPTEGIGFGLLPTAQAVDYKRLGMDMGKTYEYLQRGHQTTLIELMALQGKSPKEIVENYEMVMGFPIGWTELKPLETPSFRK
jgi:hypothetical protein